MRSKIACRVLPVFTSVAASVVLLDRLAPAVPAAAEERVNFYVSPAGNDTWSGKLADATADKSDGPFATVVKARDAARSLRTREAKRPGPTVAIYLRGGTYALPEPLVLTPEDSGTEAQPLTVAAYRDERPVLSGGRRVSGWAASEEAGHAVWMAKLPDGLPPGAVRELWVDGGRRARSRRPAKGYFSVERTPGQKREGKEKGADAFTFLRDDLKAWPTAGHAEVVLMSKWVDSRLPIKEVDEKEHRVTFTRTTLHEIEPGDAYWVEGAMDLLAEPGQWCADAKAGTIRYLPLPGEKPGAVEAVVPALEQVLRLEGRPQAKACVDHVVFRGLSFAHTRCDLPERDARGNPGPPGFHQAAIGATAAVWGQGVTHCTFDRCTVEHVGGYGLELAGGCQHDTLTRCKITDLGAGGLKVGEQQTRNDVAEQTFDNEVSDCRITDGGMMYPSGVGLWVGQSYDDRLVHNEIADFYYTAISVGWRWGYAPALTHDVRVEHNDVHHIGVKRVRPIGTGPGGGATGGATDTATDGPILSDMGGIYTLGPQRGTVIRNNRFHDIAAIKYGGWGIYFDEGSTDILAEKNLVYRTTHGGLHQHYGKDNVFRNNVIAFGREWQIARTRPEDHRSFTFERNLVYFDSGTAVSGNWSSFNALFDHNVYWAFGKGQMKFGGMDWDHWREKGMDADSVRGDPGFVDPSHGDFRLKERSKEQGGDSPAAKVGFQPFDANDVGPRQ